MTHCIKIQVEVPDAVGAAFGQGARAMVVPITEAETVQLGRDVILVHEGLSALADSLVAFVDRIEAQGVSHPALRPALEDIAGHLRRCADMQASAREVLGRAVFVKVHPVPEGRAN